MAEKKVAKWFQAGEKLNWSKSDTQAKRRAAALRSRTGNLLRTARALLALSNVTRDSKTARLARADAQYFFAQYRKKKARG